MQNIEVVVHPIQKLLPGYTHLPTEHSLFHTQVPLSATEVLLSQDRVCGTVYRLLKDRSPAMDSLGNI